MDLTPYVDNLRRELALAAEAGGEDARALAERLTAPLESTVRLTLLNALSAAADEITRELAPGSVEVRLRGLDPEFVVTPLPAGQPIEDADEGYQAGPGGVRAPAPPPPVEGDDGGTSRINFRLPDHLKGRIEEAAGLVSLSVNAWLVRVAAAALEPEGWDTRPSGRRTATGGQRYTGWVR